MVAEHTAAQAAPAVLDRATLKRLRLRLLLAYSRGMRDDEIAAQFGWSVDVLRAHTAVLRRTEQR